MIVPLASLSVEAGIVEVLDNLLDGRQASVHFEVSSGNVRRPARTSLAFHSPNKELTLRHGGLFEGDVEGSRDIVWLQVEEQV